MEFSEGVASGWAIEKPAAAEIAIEVAISAVGKRKNERRRFRWNSALGDS